MWWVRREGGGAGSREGACVMRACGGRGSVCVVCGVCEGCETSPLRGRVMNDNEAISALHYIIRIIHSLIARACPCPYSHALFLREGPPVPPPQRQRSHSAGHAGQQGCTRAHTHPAYRCDVRHGWWMVNERTCAPLPLETYSPSPSLALEPRASHLRTRTRTIIKDERAAMTPCPHATPPL